MTIVLIMKPNNPYLTKVTCSNKIKVYLHICDNCTFCCHASVVERSENVNM